MKKVTLPLAVIDFETDPFLWQREPEPFCCEFMCDDHSMQFWGDDCAIRLADYLAALPRQFMIYAHNARFDLSFMLPYIDNPARVINGRIVECSLFQHTMRDSFAIIPVPLRDYKKDKTDYATFERPVRQKNKAAILEYLHHDCAYLLELVWKFIDQFGPKLTIGAASIAELRKLHPFERLSERKDGFFRPYYFGGRVQAFRAGVLKGPWIAPDVNSMYPDRMAACLHPIGERFDHKKRLPNKFDKPFFAKIEGRQPGPIKPFPTRLDDGSLDWHAESGIFYVTNHELEAALELNLFEIDKVHEVTHALDIGNFSHFVNYWNDRKIEAEKAGDIAGRIFAKNISNSSYGKTAQDPTRYKDFLIWRDYGNEHKILHDRYTPQTVFPDFELWARPAAVHHKSYYNVAIGASITGAARAKLLRGLMAAREPVYCDTDSIICKDFPNDQLDAERLGAWKIEARANYCAIAGKKLYALFDDPKLPPVKLASKGGKLQLSDLLKLSLSERNSDGTTGVTYRPDAPSYSLRSYGLKGSPARFQTRHFELTAEVPAQDELEPV